MVKSTFSAALTRHKSCLNFLKSLLYSSKVIVKLSLTSLILLSAGLYYQTEIFDFDQAYPPTGKQLYNPYQNADFSVYKKANFHAHSKAWAGLTYGVNSDQEVLGRYKTYSIPGLSNYHQHSSSCLMNIYEHGFNLSKAHKLSIGADKVSYFDFPWRQNLSQKQTIINRIKENGGLVAIAHPNLRNGHSPEELIALRNYDFIEIASRYANAVNHWDQALNSGKKVWCMANDDTHDIEKQEPGHYYNVLLSKSTDTKKTLKDGNYYSVVAHEPMKTFLTDLDLEGELLTYSFEGGIDSVRIIIDGKTAAVSQKATERYKIPEFKRYLRLEAYTGSNIIYTNPLIKFTGAFQSTETWPSTNLTKTFLYRLKILGIHFPLVLLVLFPRQILSLKLHRRKKVITKAR